MFLQKSFFHKITVTVQQVCALAALTVRILRLKGKNPIGEADLEWIFARNREGTEQLRITFIIRGWDFFYKYLVRYNGERIYQYLGM